MNNWKLTYKKVGYFITSTRWTDEPTARKWFDQLKADASCDWCELIYSGDFPDKEYDSEEIIVEEYYR
jgi:hypothetical protein